MSDNETHDTAADAYDRMMVAAERYTMRQGTIMLGKQEEDK